MVTLPRAWFLCSLLLTVTIPKATGSGWVQICKQTVPTYKPPAEWLKSFGSVDDASYSRLDKLDDSYKGSDSKFHFKLVWPQRQGPNSNEWKQSSNPVKREPIAGYEEVNVPFKTNRWGGLEYSGSSSCTLDGSVNHGDWFYAIGTSIPWSSGIPGPAGAAAQEVELWVRVIKAANVENNAQNKPLVVALSGGSGAGKNFIADFLKDMFGAVNVQELSHDRYYRDQSHLSLAQRALLNFDHPDALESSLLLTHIKELQEGRSIEAPVYDFASHQRSSQTVQIVPARLVLVDGILLFADPVLSDAFDVRVFVDTPADLRLLRRIERDVKERGRSLASVLDQYQATVRPMHEHFVEPSKAHADLVISGQTGNRFKTLVTILSRATGLTPREGYIPSVLYESSALNGKKMSEL